MIPKECKRLAEVDFPIAAVSKCVGEKASPKGYPFMLHLWWARRPLAACRAMLLGLLLPDPEHPLCPPEFKDKARELLRGLPGPPGPTDADLRQALLRLIGDFASWDRSSSSTYLDAARGLVRAAYPHEPPLVVDPFAGGGSIPLEALRMEADVFASDLNPVASLILKVLLEEIPRCGPGLGDELRNLGKRIQSTAEQLLSRFYPIDAGGAQPIAYLWARTVCCESPGCGAEIPLVRSFWLGKNEVFDRQRHRRVKLRARQALRGDVLRESGNAPRIEFTIFEPQTAGDVPKGTVSRAKATCLACHMVLPADRVRAQLYAQGGGADVLFNAKGERAAGARLLAVVTVKPGLPGRYFRVPTKADYEAIHAARIGLTEAASTSAAGKPSLVPDERLPPIGTLGFRVQRYGILKWGDLFTARQKLAMTTLLRLVAPGSYGAATDALRPFLAFALSRVAMSGMSCTRWNPTGEKMQHTFGRQALPIVWDFAEVAPMADGPGSWQSGYEIVAEVAEAWPGSRSAAQVEQADSTRSPLPDATAAVWFTDPPYYDAVPYADLSDFFYVWLKRALPAQPLLRDPLDPANQLTPKTREIVQDETRQVNGRPKDRAFFEQAMAEAFREGRRVLRDDGVASIVFAHKTTEGWEALLSGMIRGGWTITGSWPIATEMGTRLRARDSAALATSVHLVCRPRPQDADVGDWGTVLPELPRRVGDWMERLQSEGVRGADLVFACIGPALEVFSRYSKVETADGREVGLPEFLEKVWEVVGRTALEQILGTAEAKARNGAAGAVEEDARLTALFLWTLQSTNGSTTEEETRADEEDEVEEAADDEGGPRKKPKGLSLAFDVVRRFAQPLGIDLPDWEGRIIQTEKGVVRLLPVGERAKQFFGDEGAQVAADWLERSPTLTPQMPLFPNEEGRARELPRPRRKRGAAAVSDSSLHTRREATTLDRVHAAMLLQAAGRANALRLLLKAEQERGPEFLRLANALSALYPKESEEKRLLDAMLLAMPR